MVKIIENENSISSLSDIVEEIKPNHVMLVTGTKSFDSSLLKDPIFAALSSTNYTRYSVGGSIPTDEGILDLLESMRQYNTDLVVAIGGGKVMDTAKCASVFAKQGTASSLQDLRAYIMQERQLSHDKIPLVCIPTVAGSGAEVTPFAVVYVDEVKQTLAGQVVQPNYAILDARGSYDLPPEITAASGLDVIAQAMEAYWSVHATPESREFSKEALQLGLQYLATSVHEGNNTEARQAMLKASCLAGQAIAIAKTTGAHAMSYVLTVHHNIPHGQAVLMTLPQWAVINETADCYSGLTEILSEASGRSIQSGKDVQKLLHDLMYEVNISRRVPGFTKEDAEEYATRVNPDRLKNNPVMPSEQQLVQMYMQLLE